MVTPVSFGGIVCAKAVLAVRINVSDNATNSVLRGSSLFVSILAWQRYHRTLALPAPLK